MGFLSRRHLKKAQQEYMAAAVEVEVAERLIAGAAFPGSDASLETHSRRHSGTDTRLADAKRRLRIAEQVYTTELIINGIPLPPDLKAKLYDDRA